MFVIPILVIISEQADHKGFFTELGPRRLVLLLSLLVPTGYENFIFLLCKKGKKTRDMRTGKLGIF